MPDNRISATEVKALKKMVEDQGAENTHLKLEIQHWHQGSKNARKRQQALSTELRELEQKHRQLKDTLRDLGNSED